MLRMSVSKAREFMADAGAVELTKNPNALISAIRKISENDQMVVADETVQMMMFSGPVDGWFDSHPTLEARIEALVAFAGANADLPSGKVSEPGPGPIAEVTEIAGRLHFGQRLRRPAL